MSKRNWYILNTTVGQENKVKEEIERAFYARGLDELVDEIVVPTESMQHIRRGKPVKVDKKVLPGYVMIKLLLNDDALAAIDSVSYSVRFLSGGNQPKPVPESEVNRVLGKIQKEKEEGEAMQVFVVGELVEILDGPFTGFIALVEQIDMVEKKLKVSVSIFGRDSLVTLSFNHVKKTKGGA